MYNTASNRCLIFIACREAVVLSAYPDGPHHSIGCGHNDPSLKLGDRITVQRAFELLRQDVASREAIVNRSVKVPLSQQQFDALLDLYYQNGNKKDVHGKPGWTHVVGLLNAGDYAGAAAYLPDCRCNSAGKEIGGLRKRREMEQAIFLRGDYGDLSSVPFYPGDPKTTSQRRYVIQPGDVA
jgi:lysozyme